MKIFKRIVNILTMIFSMLLLADMLLGLEPSEETIEYRLFESQQAGGLRNRHVRSVQGVQTDKNTYVLKESNFYGTFTEGDEVILFKTKLFGEVEKIVYKNIKYKYAAYTIYLHHALFPIICIISSFCALLSDRIQHSYYDYVLILSALMTCYIIISIISNNIM